MLKHYSNFLPIVAIALCSLLASCGIKDSVFDTEVRTPKLLNELFRVPTYNMAGGAVARFAVMTDSHQNYADLKETIRNINNANVDFVVHTGDFTNFGSGEEYELFTEYIRALKAPLYVVPGNHDLTTHGLKIFQEVFGPTNKAVATDFGKLIFWNNNRLESGEVDYNFLNEEIGSADSSKPVFLFHHQDPYNSLPFTAANNSLYQSNIRSHPKVIVIHGHLHRFAKQVVDNIPYFQIGRVEGGNWGLVEVDNLNTRIYYCQTKNCTLESKL